MKKNIDIPVLKQRVIWTAIMLSISVLLVLTIRKKVNEKVGNVAVNIQDLEGKRNLIEQKEILNLFKSYIGVDNLNATRMKKIETNELEELLIKDKRVKSVDIYFNGNGKLNVDIIQNQPIVRMMDGSSKSYYLDKNGKRIPVVKNNAVRVPLATGNFELYEENVIKSKKPSKIKEVFVVAKAVHNDPWMQSLVEQIDVDDKGDILLVPKIGRHYIELGDTTFLNEKFENLKLMYKEGLPRKGWDRYTSIVLKYRGQVVGRTSETPIMKSDTAAVVDAAPMFVPQNKLLAANVSTTKKKDEKNKPKKK
jgi:cell division protein FtsQ